MSARFFDHKPRTLRAFSWVGWIGAALLCGSAVLSLVAEWFYGAPAPDYNRFDRIPEGLTYALVAALFSDVAAYREEQS